MAEIHFHFPEGQALVVQTLDSAIQRISIRETNCVIQWIDFYPVDSTIQRLNNRGQEISDMPIN